MKKTLLQIIGILNIIFGSILTLSIFGIIIGVPLIISGALFLNYSSLDDNELAMKRSSIKIWSIVFIFINIISAILGLIVLTQMDEKNDKIDSETFKINFLLNLGTFLVLIACIMLVNMSLDSFLDYFKVILLFVFSILFFFLSRVFSRNIKLKFTSNIYWLVGCILFIGFFYSGGYYNLFGSSYSVNGELSCLFISSVFFIATLILYISYRLFSVKSFVRISFFTLYIAILYFVSQFIRSVDIYTAILCDILLLSSLISCYNTKNLVKRDFFIFNSAVSLISFGLVLLSNIISSNLVFVLVADLLYIFNLFLISSKYNNNIVTNIFIIVGVPIMIFVYCFSYFNIDLALIFSSIGLFILYFIFYFRRNKVKLFVPVLVITNILLFTNYIISFLSFYEIMPTIMSALLFIVYLSIMFISDYEKKYIGEVIVQPVKALLLCFALTYLVFNITQPLGAMSYIIIWSNVCLLFSILNKNKILKNIYFIIAYSLLLLCIVPINLNLMFRIDLVVMWIIGYITANFDKENWFKCVNYIFFFGSLMYLFLLFNYIGFTVQTCLLTSIMFALIAYIFRSSKSKVFTSLIFILLPYYSLINILDINRSIATILYISPYILYTYLFTYLFTRNNKTLSLILEIIINVIVLTILIFTGTLEASIFVGIISLLMIIYDTIRNGNSMFIIGIASLILNILFNIIRYWSYIPVWSYLLIGGVSLIAIVTVKVLKK